MKIQGSLYKDQAAKVIMTTVQGSLLKMQIHIRPMDPGERIGLTEIMICMMIEWTSSTLIMTFTIETTGIHGEEEEETPIRQMDPREWIVLEAIPIPMMVKEGTILIVMMTCMPETTGIHSEEEEESHIHPTNPGEWIDLTEMISMMMIEWTSTILITTFMIETTGIHLEEEEETHIHQMDPGEWTVLIVITTSMVVEWTSMIMIAMIMMTGMHLEEEEETRMMNLQRIHLTGPGEECHPGEWINMNGILTPTRVMAFVLLHPHNEDEGVEVFVRLV
mmetsp:Transcript_11755/g.21209  ORF Transcript_11755/g.21209 Transcript_11755/m.21209 type:complete len:277 (+) Transcript_11755:480-1310(+)